MPRSLCVELMKSCSRWWADDFPEKSCFLIGNCRELDHVLIFSGRLGCLGVAKPCTNCRIAAITQWCHGCRGRPNKSQSQGLKHWIDINVLYTFIYMCGTGLPVPLQGTRGGTSQDMTWYVDLRGSFEMVNMRMWLLVTKDQNSKFPIDRSFSELLTSKLVLELPSHVASFSLCRRRRKPEVHGGFQVTGAESATRSDKGSTFEPTFKDGDHSTCQASAGSTCHGAFVWSSWKAAADDGRFCGWFPGKIVFFPR